MTFYISLTFDGSSTTDGIYEAKINDLGIGATGSTLEDALMNLGIQLKGSPEFWEAVWGK